MGIYIRGPGNAPVENPKRPTNRDVALARYPFRHEVSLDGN